MSIAWFQGEFVDGPLAIDPAERGLLLGDGLFETVAIIGGQPEFLNAHLSRLEASAKEVGISCDVTYVYKAVNVVLARWAEPNGVVRITLTRGSGARGLALGGSEPSLLITVSSFDLALRFQPCTLGLADVVRHSKSPSTRLKTLSYFDNIIAARQAASHGFDEALMLNEHGAVACASIGNVFVVKGLALKTPKNDQAVLPGIIRHVIVSKAPELGFTVEEGVVTLDDMANADGVFLTNSLRILRPVSRFGSRDYSYDYRGTIAIVAKWWQDNASDNSVSILF